MLKLSIAGSLAALATCLPAQAEDPNLYVFADIKDGQLGLINTETDQILQVDAASLPGWPGNGVVFKQHAWATPDGKTIYMSIDATPPSPAGIVVFKVNDLDWDGGVADVEIEKSIIVDPPGSPSNFPDVSETDSDQPIMGWTFADYTQIHGPAFRPNTTFAYATIWTDDRVVVFDTETNEMVPGAPFSYGWFSAQTHGMAFNPSGTRALGAGYFYDLSSLDLYSFLPGNPFPYPAASIPLKRGKKLGAFTHYTVWIDDRFAYTATMQFGETSLTPKGRKVSPPALWLVDTKRRKAKRVSGTSKDADDPGVLRSASDVNIANGKLYVAEEDTLDGTFGDDGFVSIFDISDPENPVFLKRLKPGGELPADFAIAHGISVTPDERFVYVASYFSSYIVKIDTETDTVAKVFGPSDGLNVPHGGFVAGSFR